MSLPIKINVSMAPLPTNFRGTPQKWAEALVERLTLVSENGYATFKVSDSLPTINEGPVFLGGTRLYVWDPDRSEYVPLDITDSFTPAFVVSETEPDPPDDSLNPNPPVWLKIKATRFIGWYFYMGVVSTVDYGWVPMSGTTPSGPTADRPTVPHEFERFYDTDISAEIWYERSMWRTTAGVKGDVKFVQHETLDAALSQNPGWVEIGSIGTDLGQGARGRAFVPAHKDPGVDPDTDFTPMVGTTSRAAREEFGAETHVLSPEETALVDHSHKFGVESAGITGASTVGKIAGDGGHTWSSTATTNYGRTLGVGEGDVIAPEAENTNEEDGAAHNNLGLRLALWALVKL